MTSCALSKTPVGYYCTREHNHTGPCAAHLMKLQGDLQMSCETEGPYASGGSGCGSYDPNAKYNQGCPTPPYADQAKSCDPSPKSVGGCTATPRKGYNEMAASQLNSIVDQFRHIDQQNVIRTNDVITKELVRAREVGQREGREDAIRDENIRKSQVNMILTAQVEGLQKALAQAKQQAQLYLATIGSLSEQVAAAKTRPIMFEVDPRVATLQSQLAALQTQLMGVNKILQDKNNELHALNSWQSHQINTLTQSLCGKEAGIQELQSKLGQVTSCANHLEKTTGKLKAEKDSLEESLTAVRKPSKVGKVILKVPAFFGPDKLQALTIQSQITFSDGITVFVTL